MDDIRRPYRGERRDYALPAHRRPHSPPQDNGLKAAAPAGPHPAHQPRQPHPQHQFQSQPAHLPAHHASPAHHPAPEPYHAPQYQPARHHTPGHAPVKPRRRLPMPALSRSVVLATILAGAAVFGGYLLLRPDKPKDFTPANLAKQASFSFYYPTPLPNGYSYINNINAFQDGQAYYMLGSGKKHIIIHEQPAKSNNLDLSSLSNPVTYQAAGGKAALGNVAGQPAGIVQTSSTLITVNSTGDVSPADVAAVINNLHLVNR